MCDNAERSDVQIVFAVIYIRVPEKCKFLNV